MASEAAGDKLGRLLGRARKTVKNANSLLPGHQAVSESSRADEEINIELLDALARAESAELKVSQLTAELVHKEEILAEAKRALRTARVALRDHLRLTDQ